MRASSAAPPNYYEVLNIAPDASQDAVRVAFKRQVLETHPDKNPERREWSERRIRELIEAYEIIGDAGRRADFDREYRAHQRVRVRVTRRERPFFFYKKDPEARALLILHQLVHEKGDEAVELLWRMESQHGDDFLVRTLERKDYLDCLFLLGEHHLRRRQFREAARRFHQFYQRERNSRHRRHYFDQAARYLKDLYLRKLPRVIDPAELLAVLDDLDALKFSPSEERLRFLREAEANLKCGRVKAARAVLKQSRHTYPNAKENASIEAMIAKAG